MKRKSSKKIAIEKNLGRKLGDPNVLLRERAKEGGLEDFILHLLESNDKTMKQAGERLAMMWDALGLILSNEYESKELMEIFGHGKGYHLNDPLREALLLSMDWLDEWKENGWVKSGGARVVKIEGIKQPSRR